MTSDTTSLNSVSFVLGTATFNAAPPAVSGLTVTHVDGTLNGDHQQIGNNGIASATFTLPSGTLPDTLAFAVKGLVSRSGDKDGYSPITISVNGNTLVTNYTIPGNGYAPQVVTFSLPSAFLVVGANTVSIQVAADAKTYFWLYQFAVDYTGGPQLVANTQVSPITTNPGLGVVSNNGTFSGNHWIYGNNQSIVISFTSSAASGDRPYSIVTKGLVSRNGDKDGFSPITLTANGTTIVSNYTVPGNGYAAHTDVFAVPASAVVNGVNKVTLTVAANAQTYFWLYSIGVISN